MTARNAAAPIATRTVMKIMCPCSTSVGSSGVAAATG